MSGANTFESGAYTAINEARAVWVREALAIVRGSVPSTNALDLGCGGGYFSRLLVDEGYKVTGLDARGVNIERCRGVCPEGTFRVADLDTRGTLKDLLGGERFGIGFVFGLLYHLVDPVGLIRELGGVVDGVCLVSTRCAAGDGVAMHVYVEYDGDAHSERSVSMVPTRDAYVWAFRDAGWSHLYGLTTRVEHEQWDPSVTPDGLRFTFIASRTPLDGAGLVEITDDPGPSKKWERGA